MDCSNGDTTAVHLPLKGHIDQVNLAPAKDSNDGDTYFSEPRTPKNSITASFKDPMTPKDSISDISSNRTIVHDEVLDFIKTQETSPNPTPPTKTRKGESGLEPTRFYPPTVENKNTKDSPYSRKTWRGLRYAGSTAASSADVTVVPPPPPVFMQPKPTKLASIAMDRKDESYV